MKSFLKPYKYLTEQAFYVDDIFVIAGKSIIHNHDIV